MLKLGLKVIGALMITFIIAVLITVIPLLPPAEAGTRAISITPRSGYVGTTVQVTANITTVNGQYKVMFDGNEVLSGSAVGNVVIASFTVPHARGGPHKVAVVDVVTGESDALTFTMLTSYSLETDVPKPPAQRQEGDSVRIFVNVTGAEPLKRYVMNVTVHAPNKASYVSVFDIITSNVGSGNVTVIYPTDFQGANTNFVGEYRVLLNATLASKTFTIGLTNSTEYHRFQAVDVKAVYSPRENVSLTITGMGIYHSVNLTADDYGLVHYVEWAVPFNAPIGTYTVRVTPIDAAARKDPPDVQNFTVPGFDVKVTLRNLAGDPLGGVNVRVIEYGELIMDITSGADGVVNMRLEIGNYTCEAYFKGRKVGERWINVTGSTSLDLCCKLTNLRILVMDERGIRIPEVMVYLRPENQTLTTDVNGVIEVRSLLPDVAYGLNVSRYGITFNSTTIANLLVNGAPVAWFNITIIPPTLALRVNVSGAYGQPVMNAIVRASEIMGGLRYEGAADDGIAILNCIIGKYDVEVYVMGVRLNGTAVELFKDTDVSISCKLYGLSVSVRVVDYFGQPFPNATVTLQREGLEPLSSRTELNGVATFRNVIGGRTQVAVRLPGQAQPCIVISPFIDKSLTIEVKVSKYVLLAGLLIETSQLATAIVIVATVALTISIEVYRRRYLKRK